MRTGVASRFKRTAPEHPNAAKERRSYGPDLRPARRYHRRIAEFFEDCLAIVAQRAPVQRGPDRAARDAVIRALRLTTKDLHLLLADHYTRSRSSEDKAMAYSLVAAKDATTLGLYREAEQLYRRVATQATNTKQNSFAGTDAHRVAHAARLNAFVELAELYARFELEPRPKEAGEPAPLGEGPINVLAHGLSCLGVEGAALGQDGFAGLDRTSRRGEVTAPSRCSFFLCAARSILDISATLWRNSRPSGRFARAGRTASPS